VLLVVEHHVGQPLQVAEPTQKAAGPRASAPEYWVVEATATRAGAAATYELRHDAGADTWTLSRA